MKTVKDFVQEVTHGSYSYDVFLLLNELDTAGYYSYNSWQVDVEDAKKCRDWCEENCPNEYMNIAGHIYFDNKNHAMLMRLSVL